MYIAVFEDQQAVAVQSNGTRFGFLECQRTAAFSCIISGMGPLNSGERVRLVSFVGEKITRPASCKSLTNPWINHSCH